MACDNVWKILAETGAILKDDHFVYTKGGHGSEYINKDALFMHPTELARLCQEIANQFTDTFLQSRADVVLGPAVGGALVAQWVAYFLKRATVSHEVLALYADKVDDGFVLQRGYDAFMRDKNVLVVEDVLNTGGSVKQVVELARSHGGKVIGVGALCNRGNVRLWDIGDPPILYSLVSVNMTVYDSSQCPLCAQGKPINTKIGKGAKFVAEHGQPKAPA